MASAEVFDPQGNGFGMDLGSSASEEPRINTVEFGDGYVQRAGDGLNANPVRISAKFTNLTEDERDYIIDFMRERAGYKPISWTTDKYGTRLYICPKWSSAQVTGAVFNVSAEFVEVFDL